jgi:branched-chain amino acid transport system permease protein
MERVRASSLTILMASFGLLLVMQNALSLVFGDDPKSLRTGIVSEGYLFLGARITAIQVTTIMSVIAVFGTLGCFLRFTNLGKALRAVANDRELAEVVGLDIGTLVLLTFVLGSTLAGLAAVLAAYDTALTPLMGFRALLGAVVAVVIGGRGSILGMLLGGLFIGLVQNLVVWQLPSQWQDPIVFCVLIAFLLLRPQGFFGKPLHKAAV